MTTPLMSHDDHALCRGLETLVSTSPSTACAHNSRRAHTVYNRHFSLMYMACARRVRVRPSPTIEPIQVAATQHDKCVSPTDGDNLGFDARNLGLGVRNLGFRGRNLGLENITSVSDSMLVGTYVNDRGYEPISDQILHVCGRARAHAQERKRRT
jgi:hypothetical protein